MKIQVYDTTLRDGAQGFGISFTRNDKLNIISALDELGVDYIEAGNFAIDEDMKIFEACDGIKLKNARLVAFGSTCRPGTKAADDPLLRRITETAVEDICVFGKSRLLHVEEILRTTPDENLRIIYDTISFLKSRGKRVIFDAEQFFDGYSDDPPYAVNVLRTAREAGADSIVLCDTNGAMLPDVIGMVCSHIHGMMPDVNLGIHCHNDLGMAVACTLEAVISGVSQIHVTVSGIGERCGNTNLNTIVPLLQLKMGYNVIPPENLRNLTQTARYVNEIANNAFDESEPFVGGSAFTHKAGMHVDAVNKNPASFEHTEPESVGNERNILISALSGKSAVHSKMLGILPGITKDSPLVAAGTQRIKQLEAQGYRFEDAEASLSLRLREIICPEQGDDLGGFFKLMSFNVMISESKSEIKPVCSAVVKIKVGDSEEITAAEGQGPVNALDLALRKALSRFYPKISQIRLCDYKVRVLDSGSENTASKVLVRVSTTDNKSVWRTVGVSPDIIDASWQALSDSMIYFLEKEKASAGAGK